MTKDFMIIAHRGASAYELENSIAAFKKAIEMKANMIELDVHRTKDKRIVVIHDDDIKRLTMGKGQIKKMAYSHILDYPLKNGECIPLLEEVFARVNNQCELNIEIKCAYAEKEIVRLIRDYNLTGDILISSFRLRRLHKIRKQEPLLKTGLIVLGMKKKTIDKVVEMGMYSIHPKYTRLSYAMIRYAQEKGLKVYPWTVDDPNKIQLLINYGVDGIITNKPDLVRKILEEK